MEKHNQMRKDLTPLILGQAIGAAAIMGIFAVLGRFDRTVLVGSLAGAALAIGNYAILYFFACKAADKAAAQDVTGGQKLIQLSYMGRMTGLLIILILLAKSGWCNVIALAVPLALNRPILSIHEMIEKKGGAKQ